MVSREQIQDLCDQIVRRFHPRKVVLFGSFAYGQPSDDSDVDLLVLLPFEGSPIHKAIEISSELTWTFPLDLLVRTPEYVEQRVIMGDFFLREIMQKGKVLYDAALAGVGAEG